jgi:hypothetical protein
LLLLWMMIPLAAHTKSYGGIYACMLTTNVDCTIVEQSACSL